MSDKKSVFQTLSTVNMLEHIETDQGGNRYIKWADVWAVLLEHYPEATFETHLNDVGDAFFVSVFGIEVRVSVTVNGLTRTFTHPVLNSINKSMKIEGYTYKTKKGDRSVEPASTFDINTARMRALVKCVALHGLAIYLYRDDLLPQIELVDSKGLQMIIDKIKEKGFILSEICSEWQIPKLANLQEANVDVMMDYLETRK